MKLVVDMNLSPEWLPFLHAHGFEAVHWSATLRVHREALERGAILAIDATKTRIRILPI